MVFAPTRGRQRLCLGPERRPDQSTPAIWRSWVPPPLGAEQIGATSRRRTRDDDDGHIDGGERAKKGANDRLVARVSNGNILPNLRVIYGPRRERRAPETSQASPTLLSSRCFYRPVRCQLAALSHLAHLHK